MTWWHELTYGLRLLWKTPTTFFAAVVSLALGIGANSAIFSFVDALLFRPAPGIERPERLAAVFTAEGEGNPYGPSSYADYLYLREHNDAFTGLAAFKPVQATLRGPTETEVVWGALASEDYFDVLGVDLAVGRAFEPAQATTSGADPVVILSHSLWQRRFGGERDVVGREIGLNGRTFTVIGVSPPRFQGTSLMTTPTFWVPIQWQPHFMPAAGPLLENRGWRGIHVVGRLAPGVEITQAQANLRTLMDRLRQAYPDTNEERQAHLTPAGIAKMSPGDRGLLVGMSTLLLSIVALVLLMACVNLANVLLARTNARRRELSVRVALGASRWRLARQLVAESVGVGLLGGAAGLLVAGFAMPVLERIFGSLDLDLGLRLDVRVLLFTLGLSLVVSVLIGLGPALRATRADLAEAIKDTGAASSARGGRITVRSALVVVQIGLSLVLLIGASLFLRSLLELQTIDFGFQTRHLVTASGPLNSDDGGRANLRAYHQELIDRIGALPEVSVASLTHVLPLSGDMDTLELRVPGRDTPSEEGMEVGFSLVDHRYFEALDVNLMLGRDFERSDRPGTPPVMVVNRRLAERLWPEGDPVGQRLDLGALGSSVEVVGVVENTRHVDVRESFRPYFYLPYLQHADRPIGREMSLVARTQGRPHLAVEPIRRVVRSIDPDVPTDRIQPFSDRIASLVFPERLAAGLLTAFGLMALFLTAVGIYAVISYFVSQRTREIGVRIALGAERAQVLWLIFRRGGRLLLIGLVIGVGAAAALSQLLTSFLFGVSATDPAVFVTVPLVISLIAVLAVYLPARRAARLDPQAALRYE